LLDGKRGLGIDEKPSYPPVWSVPNVPIPGRKLLQLEERPLIPTQMPRVGALFEKRNGQRSWKITAYSRRRIPGSPMEAGKC